MLGQLPVDRLSPGLAFQSVGVDFQCPVLVKKGPSRKPTFNKAYICIFVCLSVKATHLELVSDLTTETFLAALRRFVSCCGEPSIIRSNHGAACEL